MTPPMKNDLVILDEPSIEFKYGQRLVQPQDGLTLFGPYDANYSSQPPNMTYGLIGTEKGLKRFHSWSEIVMGGRATISNSNDNLWPLFPGFEAAMQCRWPIKPAHEIAVDEGIVVYHAHLNDPHLRTASVVSDYITELEKFALRDEEFGFVICIIPDEVWRYCRPKSRVEDGIGHRPTKKELSDRRLGQLSILENDWSPEIYQFSEDFRRQMKARSLKYEIPIQIIRESTLSLSDKDDETRRRLTPLSDRAWNLSTALYYKAGGKPWRLASAREGVCYIGISFKKTDAGEESKTACCAAQMFLDSGDGIMFLGDKGPWYAPSDRQFHLSRDAARALLSGVLKTYSDLEGKELREIFLHSRSEIAPEEFEGYKEACPSGVKLVGIRVRPERNIRLMRKGRFPVARGTYWQISDREAYLWTTGYKWKLRTFDGFGTPIPLRINLMYGDADIAQISRDIFGLTKLDYNACKIGIANPVTIQFSDSVGEILISNPLVKNRNPKFKFYI